MIRGSKINLYLITNKHSTDIMKTAKITNEKKNCMGTTSLNMKAGRMRKAQRFIIYPIGKQTSAKIIKLQSESYWAEIDLSTGQGELSARHSHPNSWAFSLDQAKGKTTKFKLSNLDQEALRLQIFTSANKAAGNKENGMVQTDNSGAISILDI